MTPEERARKLLNTLLPCPWDGDQCATCEQFFADEIREAEERVRRETIEECAAVCDRKAQLTSSRDAALTYGRAADAIRSLPRSRPDSTGTS